METIFTIMESVQLYRTKRELDNFLSKYSLYYYDDDNVDLDITETTAGYIVTPIWS